VAFYLSSAAHGSEFLRNHMANEVHGVKADGWTSNSYHKFIKRQKNRIERRRAKHNPDCVPAYGKYKGWES
jgi:hypothetical protein